MGVACGRVGGEAWHARPEDGRGRTAAGWEGVSGSVPDRPAIVKRLLAVLRWLPS